MELFGKPGPTMDEHAAKSPELLAIYLETPM